METLDAEKLEIAKLVESKQENLWRISDAIWSYAELGLEEYKSSKLLANTLEKVGFKVDLTHTRSGKTASYKKYYTEKTARMIAQRYEQDIKMFGYRY